MRLALLTYLLLTVNLSWAGGEMKKVCHEDATNKKVNQLIGGRRR